MAKKRLTFSGEIREAIKRSGLSRYAICKELGMEQSQLSRFVAGKCWLGEQNLDALAELLGLHVSTRKEKRYG
jgi:transcriptional regulator with XRE-family HTH domain